MSPVLPVDVAKVRSRFPALQRVEAGRPVAYLDGPGGTQVPDVVIEAMRQTLLTGVSNLGGGFGASLDADRIVEDGRMAVADLFGASPDEISFGQNMTSITFAVSRALSRSWRPGDAIVVTSLDHDANYTPWVRAAQDRDVEVRVAEFDPSTAVLEPDAVGRLLDKRVRLMAVPLASNAIGTVVDVAAMTAMAREVGAQSYVDGVHAAPHRYIDVAALGCDFLVASAYKFFGPHTGVLYGRRSMLDAMDFYKVRPAPSDPPGKLETGTQSFESIVGVTAAIDYLAGLTDLPGSRRDRLRAAFAVIGHHETSLARRFGEMLTGLAGVEIHGLPADHPDRVPTFAISLQGASASALAARLASQGIYVWAGHYYAVNAMDRLGVLDDGGLLRVGFVHYNTVDEVTRAANALRVPA